VCVIGPGKAFLSGVTYHTYGLVTALSRGGPTSVIVLRNLVPRRMYPGRDRVGADLTHLRLPADVGRTGTVDWWWGAGIVDAGVRLVARPPAVVVVQWWSAAVWHTELALVVLARLRGARVVVEVHELMDTAEQRHSLAGVWSRTLGPLLMAQADRVVVHNRADQAEIVRQYGIRRSHVEIVAEPPFDHYDLRATDDEADADGDVRPASERVELLFFGTIRPYKGLEDLIEAFERLVEDADDDVDYRLTVVGETWEGWTGPVTSIGRSPHRHRITFVNRYVTDEEVDQAFRAADLVVLPYRRSSTSGPLMVAMSYGLPVVVTAVGGLPEAVEGYSGAVQVEPASVDRLADGIRKAELLIGVRHRAGRSWRDVADQHEALYRTIGVEARG
jgi:glycosyltransferase involved in cell wall biosynthesis